MQCISSIVVKASYSLKLSAFEWDSCFSEFGPNPESSGSVSHVWFKSCHSLHTQGQYKNQL